MIAKLHFPTLLLGVAAVPGQFPPIDAGEDVSQRRAEQYAALDRAVTETCDNLSRVPEQSSSFGDRLTQAVRVKQTMRHNSAVVAEIALEESFGERLKEAVEKRSGQKGAQRTS